MKTTIVQNEEEVRELTKRIHPEIIMMCRFGSHLYGTDTPESDADYKGIFMPTKSMILGGKIPKSIRTDRKKKEGEKNTKDDVDFELYSLHYFIKLACKGETAAIDMLHVNEKNLLISSDVWERIVAERSSFYTKNLKAFVGYARRQAAKYGVKGSRLSTAQEFINVARTHTELDWKLSAIWDKLPQGEHAHFIEDNPQGIKQYQICGKVLQETITLEYAQGIILTFLQKYGERAKKAARNEGIDWKAISHALRAAYQVQEIFKYQTITFPLKHADYLRRVKLGEIDFTSKVQPKMENLISALEQYSIRSALPEKVDVEYWGWVIYSIMHKHIISKTFNITSSELHSAWEFAKEHGEHDWGVVTMEIIFGNIGDTVIVKSGNKEKNVTNVDSW